MTEKRKNIITAVLIISGILFIILGILRNENVAVFSKAVRICLECIGIG